MSVVNRFMSRLITELRDACLRGKPTRVKLRSLIRVRLSTQFDKSCWDFLSEHYVEPYTDRVEYKRGLQFTIGITDDTLHVFTIVLIRNDSGHLELSEPTQRLLMSLTGVTMTNMITSTKPISGLVIK